MESEEWICDIWKRRGLFEISLVVSTSSLVGRDCRCELEIMVKDAAVKGQGVEGQLLSLWNHEKVPHLSNPGLKIMSVGYGS